MGVVQDCPSLLERQRSEKATVQPEDIEDVVIGSAEPAPPAGSFAIEHEIIHRQSGDCLDDARIRAILRETIAGEKSYFATILEGDNADAIEFALEEPLRGR